MSCAWGEDCNQATLLPSLLNDYVPVDGLGRVIGTIWEGLDFNGLWFAQAASRGGVGRPAYVPRDLLKRYVYVYLYAVRSSRRLARECRLNSEAILLLLRLATGFMTISDFHRDNATANIGACRAFVLFCLEADLFNAHLLGLGG